MSTPAILLATADGVAEITLNRPEKLNAFTAAMHHELAQALNEVAADGRIRAVLLTGAGRAFCAGQDLDDRRVAPGAEPVDLGHTIETHYNPLIRRLAGLAKPVICAVNGTAAGAGANIALACDIVLAAQDAKFIQAFCKIGLIPDSGGTWRLPRLIGLQRAMGLAMLGEAVTGAQAEAWGLVWKAYPADSLMEEARTLARHLAQQPTGALAKIKWALGASYAHTLDQQLDLERDFQREAGRSNDYREGVAAFLEKRTPRFTGT